MLLLCLPGAATHRPRQLWRQSSCQEPFRPPSPSAHTPHTRPTSPTPLAHPLSQRHRQRGTMELLRCYHLVHRASSKAGASSAQSKRFAQVGSISAPPCPLQCSALSSPSAPAQLLPAEDYCGVFFLLLWYRGALGWRVCCEHPGRLARRRWAGRGPRHLYKQYEDTRYTSIGQMRDHSQRANALRPSAPALCRR